MTSEFTCLEPEFFAFLTDLTHNNRREWFEANKARFREAVQEPLVRLVEAIGPELLTISPWFVADPKLNGGSIFRIYRDTRFSSDKTPYKTNAAAQFRHRNYRNVHTPGFYVHLAPDSVFFGGGIWLPEAAALQKIRERIRDKPEDWAAVRNDNALRRVHGTIDGEALTRPPRGFSTDLPWIEDIKRKSFFAMVECTPDAALQPGFLTAVVASFRAAAPLVAFLCAALEVPY